MRKKIAKFSILPLAAGSIFFSFSTKDAAKLNLEDYSTYDLDLDYTVDDLRGELKPEFKFSHTSPVLGKSYVGFKEALAFKESGGDYKSINEYGYLGKYQFGVGTLNLVGIYDTINFLNSPALQEAAFYANASRNKWILQRDIKRFEGKTINGVKVTESGILAAAHLAGPGSVKKYLRSWGAQAFSDAFGTTIKNYMKRFGGYDVSFIETKKNARVDFESL
ncbi:peptidoglycan-binding protein LysM [Christiangramia salexigens]|uniref:Peptidoglycan-binding protein LysM n=1 Tax=Christiangramia salexigens TaxID=1913577 RepID=A0A1L3J1G1_9FLAO|nr:peptidoglycan-binding protein LysM [Christiangramia salexigens]APG58966.1 peptidoglycan-binding protein LysM [Christiangramia salexigens]